MNRFAALALVLIASPALADGPHYQAEPVVPPSKAKFLARDTLWRCAEAHCVAAESGSRPAIVCAVLARQVGPLRSFTVAGQALAAEELDHCNGRARKLTPEAVQTAASR
jgi:hypothetical protein